jgi:hypothetical protein
VINSTCHTFETSESVGIGTLTNWLLQQQAAKAITRFIARRASRPPHDNKKIKEKILNTDFFSLRESSKFVVLFFFFLLFRRLSANLCELHIIYTLLLSWRVFARVEGILKGASSSTKTHFIAIKRHRDWEPVVENRNRTIIIIRTYLFCITQTSPVACS